MTALVIDAAGQGVTAQELAATLDECEGTSAHPWIAGHVLVRGMRLWIDRAASDRLAARVLGVREPQGRSHNENHSDFMVAGGLGVRHTDGRGWAPVEPGGGDRPYRSCGRCGAEVYDDGGHVLDRYDRQSNGYPDCEEER